MEQAQIELLGKTHGRELIMEMAEMPQKESTDAGKSVSTTRKQQFGLFWHANEHLWHRYEQMRYLLDYRSLLLTTNDQHIASIFILCLCILVNLCSTYIVRFLCITQEVKYKHIQFVDTILLFNTAGYKIGSFAVYYPKRLCFCSRNEW